MHAASIAMTVLLTGSPPAADAGERIAGERGERMAAWVRSCADEGFSGSVIAARGGEVSLAVGVGFADLDGSVPNTPDTLFEIASVTKPFTAVAVMQLVEAGELALDDSIARHLPGVPRKSRAITVRHLLQHTSGISPANAGGRGNDVEALLPQYLKGGPEHPPGTNWRYWNQGYALLSEIVARAEGRSFKDHCRESIFQRAGMPSTRFTGDPPPDGAVVAVGRSVLGPPRSALEHPYGEDGLHYRGMGGIVTTAWDLHRWDRALADGTLLAGPARDMLFEPNRHGYALGWVVGTSRSGRRIQSHTGLVRGFLCLFQRFPDDDACIAVLANRDDANIQLVARGLEAMLFDEPWNTPPETSPLDEDRARGLAGRYVGDGVVMDIERDGAETRVRLEWTARGEVREASLVSRDDGQLLWKETVGMQVVEVRRDERGNVETLTIGSVTVRRANPD